MNCVLIFVSGQCLAYEVIFDRVSERAGLNSNFVLCVAQSDDGYIWVGTQSGLQRYDGYRMASFSNGLGKAKLPPKPVEQVLQSDQPNKIWVRTGNTVGLFNTKDFSYEPIHLEDTGLNGMNLYVGANKQTYLILKGKSLLRYSNKKKGFLLEDGLKEIPADFGPSTMQLLSNGDFYLAGKKGMGFFNARNKRFYTAENNSINNTLLKAAADLSWIRLFFIDSKGRCFLETWPPKGHESIFLLVPGSDAPKRLTVSAMLKNGYFGLNDIVEHGGLVWAYGGGIFNVFDDKSAFESFYDPLDPVYGISSANIFQLIRDKDNNLWLATDNGLYMAFVVGNYMRNASVGHIFGNHDQTSILELKRNQFLLGSWGSGVQAFRYNSEHVLFPDEELPNKFTGECPRPTKIIRWYGIWPLISLT